MSYQLTFKINNAKTTPKVDSIDNIISNASYWESKEHLKATVSQPVLVYIDRSSGLDASIFPLVDESVMASPMPQATEANIWNALSYLTTIIGKDFRQTSTPEDANLIFYSRETKPAEGISTIIGGQEVGVAGFASQSSTSKTPSYRFSIVLSKEANYKTIIHELGHALGLEHPHETDDGDLHPAYGQDGIVANGDYIMGYGSLNSLSNGLNFNPQETEALKQIWTYTPEILSQNDIITGIESNKELNGPKFKKSYSDNLSLPNITIKRSEYLILNLSDFPGIKGKKVEPSRGEQEVIQDSRKKAPFIFDQKSGLLAYNQNGIKSGFGAGGFFAYIEGNRYFNKSDIIFSEQL